MNSTVVWIAGIMAAVILGCSVIGGVWNYENRQRAREERVCIAGLQAGEPLLCPRWGYRR